MAEGDPLRQARRPRFPLHNQILLGMALGLVLGPLLGKEASPLGEIGKLVVQLVKAAATPLLFLAIVHAILKADVKGRSALRLLGWASLNATIALAVGLLLSNLFQPGRSLADFHGAVGSSAAYAGKKIDVLATIQSYIPQSLVTPFAENLVLSIVLIAVLVGFGLRRVRQEYAVTPAAAGGARFQPVEDAVGVLLRLMELILAWVIKLIPFAVFGVVARAVGEHGYAPLRGLAVYVAVGVGGLLLHSLLTYNAWLLIFTRLSPRTFWREAREPVTYALGANSSLATLPVTLRALDRLGVSRSSSALGACVGTNFNNDGIILYEGMAVLFVAQAAGFDLSLGQQLLAAGACLVAAMGVAGVPEAGFISLALVLNTVGLPIEILPLLLTVDWIIARGRSAVNVLSDMMLSVLLDRRRDQRLPEPQSGPGPALSPPSSTT